jgi:hypothetical protein
MQASNVRASLRHGIKMVSSMVGAIKKAAKAAFSRANQISRGKNPEGTSWTTGS